MRYFQALRCFFMATWLKTSQRFLPWASDVLISTYLAYTPAFVSSRLQFNIIILIDFGAKRKWITKKGMMVYYSTLGIDGVRLHMRVGSHDWKERSSSTWDKESLLGLLAVFLFCSWLCIFSTRKHSQSNWAMMWCGGHRSDRSLKQILSIYWRKWPLMRYI